MPDQAGRDLNADSSIMTWEALGTMVAIKARPAFVDQVNLHLAYCQYDTIFYRLNIYRTESGQPVERIYSSPHH